MATLRSLNINIRAGTASLASDFRKAHSVIGRFQQSASAQFKKVTGSVFNLRTAIVGLVGSAGFGLLLKEAFTSIDELAKSADKLGLTTTAMAGLSHAADLAGVNAQKLNIGLVTMQKNLGDASLGSGTAVQALGQLGIKVKDIINLSPDKQFGIIADKINNVKNATIRADIAYRVFGSSGVDLINVLKEGSKGLSETTDEAIKLGIAVNRVDSAKIEMANDAFTRSKDAIKGVANIIAIALAPYLKYAADWFTELVKRNNGFRDSIASGFKTTIKAIALFGDALQYGKIGFYALEVAGLTVASSIANAYKAINDAITALVNNLVDKIRGPILSVLEKLGKHFDYAKKLAEDLNSLKVEPDQSVINWSTKLERSLINARTQLYKFGHEKMPTERINNFFDNIKKNSEVAANEVALQSGKLATDTGKTVEVVSKKGKDLFSQLTQAGNNWADSFTNTLSQFVKTGKLNFKSFADSVISDLIRIGIYRTITMPLFGAAGIPGFAGGGIMSSQGPMPLNRYAGGGIANTPQMAIFGEGSRPEAFVPLPDGRAIPVKIQGDMSGTTVVNNYYSTNISAVDGQSVARLILSQPQAVAMANQSIYNRNGRTGGPFR